MEVENVSRIRFAARWTAEKKTSDGSYRLVAQVI